jgi:hypothetical protein
MPTTIDLGLTGVETPGLQTAMHVPIVSDSEGETISADTSQTHEELPGDVQPEFSLAQQELLHWHHWLNHLPFSCIQEMAKQHLLPTHLAKYTFPLCSGCTYGKMTRRPWRAKAPYVATPKIATAQANVYLLTNWILQYQA